MKTRFEVSLQSLETISCLRSKLTVKARLSGKDCSTLCLRALTLQGRFYALNPGWKPGMECFVSFKKTFFIKICLKSEFIIKRPNIAAVKRTLDFMEREKYNKAVEWWFPLQYDIYFAVPNFGSNFGSKPRHNHSQLSTLFRLDKVWI